MVSVWHCLRHTNMWLQYPLREGNSIVVMSLRIETLVRAQESPDRNLAHHVSQVHTLKNTGNKLHGGHKQ